VIIYVGLAVALAMLVFWAFLPETIAVAWHVRHGSEVRFRDLRIPVPLTYIPLPDTDNVALYSSPGWLRGLGGSWVLLITFDTRTAHHTPERIPTQLLEKLARAGITEKGTKSVTLGGKPGKCTEYSHQANTGGMSEIRCSFEGAVQGVHFFGTPRKISDFYWLLSRVTRT
jgi:hypothetical protein